MVVYVLLSQDYSPGSFCLGVFKSPETAMADVAHADWSGPNDRGEWTADDGSFGDGSSYSVEPFELDDPGAASTA